METRQLGYGLGLDQVRGLVFGQLIRLAGNGITYYQSDLYHDALWLHDHLEVGVPFFWSYDDCGTMLSTDERRHMRKHAFRILLRREGRLDRWVLDITGSPAYVETRKVSA